MRWCVVLQNGFSSGSFRSILISNNIQLLSKDLNPDFEPDDIKNIRKISKRKDVTSNFVQTRKNGRFWGVRVASAFPGALNFGSWRGETGYSLSASGWAGEEPRQRHSIAWRHQRPAHRRSFRYNDPHLGMGAKKHEHFQLPSRNCWDTCCTRRPELWPRRVEARRELAWPPQWRQTQRVGRGDSRLELWFLLIGGQIWKWKIQ